MIPTFKDSFKFICIFTKFKIVFCKECSNSEETLGYCCPSHKKILIKYDFTKFCFFCTCVCIVCASIKTKNIILKSNYDVAILTNYSL